MGKGGTTIGFHYLGSVLFGLGRGPVNCLTHIKIADKMAWEGGVSDNRVLPINQPDLFGGKTKEGGIQGLFRNFMGKYTQVLPGASPTTAVGSSGPYTSGVLPDIKTAMGGLSGEFRGRHLVWYDGLLSSMNPYIKEWEFRRWRTTAGWQDDEPWYPEKATIFLKGGAIRAMNPAHIIYQCITDPAWGRGRPASELNENSFIIAANAFCSEGFGLCIHWMRSDEIGNFVKTIVDHSAAVLYTDRETGLINIKLIRDDYDPDLIPHFTIDSGLMSINEDDTGSSDSILDEVIVEGKDPISNQAIEGRSHNLAVRRFRGGASTSKLSYPGLPTIELCNRVAERDRNTGAAGLRKFTVKLNRAGFRIHPGAVFKITYLPRGLDGIVLRAGDIDDGNMIKGEITIKCMQDVFSLPLISFVTPVENTFSQGQEPEPAEAEIFEASYRDLYMRMSSGDLAVIGEGDALFGVTAAKPNAASIGYNLIARAEGEPAFGGPVSSYFTATAKLDASIGPIDDEIVLRDLVDWDDPVGMMGRIDGEYVFVTAWDEDTMTATVTRGCVDTWPRAHEADTHLWLVDDDLGTDSRTYSEGETVEAKVLTKTSSKVLAQADADLLSLDLVGRPFRPYPPADVQVGGISVFDPVGTPAEPEVTWVERNRLTQADVAVGFFDATVAAETATTYRIKIYGDDPDGAVVATHDGVTSPWTYEAADQITDGTDGLDLIYARIFAVRDGVESLEQPLAFPLRADEGYGINYGNNYGGDPDYGS